jgi:hypothetical protein
MLARALVASAVISRGERPRARCPAQQQQRSCALGGAPRPSGQQQQAGDLVHGLDDREASGCEQAPLSAATSRGQGGSAGEVSEGRQGCTASSASRGCCCWQTGRRRRWPAGSAQGSQPARLPSIPHPLTHSSLILCPWRQQQQQQLVRATARPSGRPAAFSRAARPSSDRRRTTARAELETAWSCSVCLARPGIPP